MKYIGPVSFFFEGDKEQALSRQLIARKQIQETVDLVGGIPGTRGFRREYPDGTVIITAVEVGETWVAPKAVVYVPVRKRQKSRKIIAIPFEVYVRGSAYTVDDFCVEGRTKVYVAEFTIAGDFKSLVYLGDTLPEGVKLTDEEKENGDTIFSWDKYQKCGPYLIAGTADMTMGEFAEPGATSAAGIKYLPFLYVGKAKGAGEGSSNRFNPQIKGNIYNAGKLVEPLPTLASGAVMVQEGLVIIGQLDSVGVLTYWKKEDGKWVGKEINLGTEDLGALVQSFQFKKDKDGGAYGIAFAGYSRTLWTKTKIEISINKSGKITTATATPLWNSWDVEPEYRNEIPITYEFKDELNILEPSYVDFNFETNSGIKVDHKANCFLVNASAFWYTQASWFWSERKIPTITVGYGIEKSEKLNTDESKIWYRLSDLSLEGGDAKFSAPKTESGTTIVFGYDGTADASIQDGFPVWNLQTAPIDGGKTAAGPHEGSKFDYYIQSYITIGGLCDGKFRTLKRPFSLKYEKKTQKPEENDGVGPGRLELKPEQLEMTVGSNYRVCDDLTAFTRRVKSLAPEQTTITTKDYLFDAPETSFAVGNYYMGDRTGTLFGVEFDDWLRIGLEFIPADGCLPNKIWHYQGLDLVNRDFTHTAVYIDNALTKSEYFPLYGFVGITPIDTIKEGNWTKVRRITESQFDGLNDYYRPGPTPVIGSCPSNRIIDTYTDDIWKSKYIFDADPEYAIAVVYQFNQNVHKHVRVSQKITNMQTYPYWPGICEITEQTEAVLYDNVTPTGRVDVYRKEGIFLLGVNSYLQEGAFITHGDSGPMVRPPYAPYEGVMDYVTPLNTAEKIQPYGSSIVTQYFGVEHYSIFGICDGRLYTLPHKILDLALVSGGWWMRDAGTNGLNETYSNDVTSINNSKTAEKIKKWFDEKYPSNSQQDYRFLGLSLY